MKIIDILNKISRGEEPPKKINYCGKVYTYDKTEKEYFNSDKGESYYALFDTSIISTILNDEVEILQITIHNEEDNFTGIKWYQDGKEICSTDYSCTEPKKIEKLSYSEYEKLTNEIDKVCYLIRPINEIIDKVNDL